jgi:hypothetical protein
MAGAPLTEPACLPACGPVPLLLLCCPTTRNASFRVQITSPVHIAGSTLRVLSTDSFTHMSVAQAQLNHIAQLHPSTPKNRPDMGEKKRMHYK